MLVYRSLDRPNAKLVPLLLTADALRRAGASRLVLVAPYLCYLRQDTVFRPGEALSRDVVARLLADAFDEILTVDPHLHRTGTLGEVFGRPVMTASAGGVLAARLGPSSDTVVVGPDEEAGRVAAALGAALRAPHLTLRKQRQGDEAVEIAPPPATLFRHARAVLVDDMCSTGGTLAAATVSLYAAGAKTVEVAVTHGLFVRGALARLTKAGAAQVVATDSCAGVCRPAPLAATLAAALDRANPL
ncbi:ribose-phosphate diphosphokinase [Phenylobacterium sp. J367]|uniref:ribose-phosphate diphosphokinase n=1 Tax=Phenylobacterium sp. J367 TaxID=2898435 RepID=UPI002150877B|nr:ribose-phosphate diphosphokinase [Phenylobacterium sp. J367]MCR5879286.1 ribose-phosphate diphosphokinase [Phenylobacterium sp. J367]